MNYDILHSKNPLEITQPKLLNVGGYQVRDFQDYDGNTTSDESILAPYEEDGNS